MESEGQVGYLQGPFHIPFPELLKLLVFGLSDPSPCLGSTDRHRPPFSSTDFLVTISVMRMHIRLTSDPLAPPRLSAGLSLKCRASQPLNRSCTQQSLAGLGTLLKHHHELQDQLRTSRMDFVGSPIHVDGH